ncbi:MAG: HNH endonuclease [Sulfurospirillum sp.]
MVCGRPAQIADHIIELRDGGEPLSLENIQCMCSPCHNRKSAKEAAKRR